MELLLSLIFWSSLLLNHCYYGAFDAVCSSPSLAHFSIVWKRVSHHCCISSNCTQAEDTTFMIRNPFLTKAPYLFQINLLLFQPTARLHFKTDHNSPYNNIIIKWLFAVRLSKIENYDLDPNYRGAILNFWPWGVKLSAIRLIDPLTFAWGLFESQLPPGVPMHTF